VQSIEIHKVGEIAIFRTPAIDTQGRSIFPERYNLEDLQMMQQEDPVFFAGQYLLAPAAGGASDFKPEWLKFYELDGHQIRFRGQDGRLRHTSARELVCFISVDPAISDSHSAARSAVPVAATNGTEIFLLEDFAKKGLGMFDLAHRVVDFYLRYRPRFIFIETIVYQRAFMEALAQVARDRGADTLMGAVQEIRSHGRQSKDFRIYGLEPFFKSGRFYVHKSHTNFIQEYSAFPRGALRDTIDALSFQKDAWERIAAQNTGAGGKPVDREAAHAAAIARMKSNMGRGGGY
jgi:predicted phage terminase large subunit-like protein